MAIDPMYPAKAGSPKTMLAEGITNSATTMTVVDSSVLPPAPNICVIGEDENAEVVGYTGINGNTITGLLRGLEGSGTTASPWIAGTAVARNFTSFDHDRFIDNINDLSANLALKAPIANPAFTGIPTAPTPNADDDSTQIATTEYVQGELEDVMNAISGKQDTLRFDTTPTANSTNPVESGGVKTALDTLDDTKVSKSGDTMTGVLGLPGGGIKINTNDATRLGYAQIRDYQYSRLRIMQYPAGSSYAESYAFPSINTSITGNKNYEILTSKTPVTVQQGGTNATVITGTNGAAHNLFPTNLYSTIQYLTGMTQSWESTGYVKLPLPVALGGTGADDVASARKSLGYIGMFFAQSVNTDEYTEIPENANLNTAAYTATGRYVCTKNTIVGTLINKPDTNRAFQMLVYNLLGATTGRLPSGTWESRTRIAMDYSGRIFTSYVEKASNSNDYIWSVWKEIQQS